MQVNDVLSLAVTELALGGKAVARHEGRVVFVDRALPGDRVRARITHLRRRYAEARLESVEQPSPDRVPPPCPHVEICGGCRLQHLAYPAQLQIKERQVRDTLIHIGGIPDPPLHAIVPAPAAFGYRNKMEFSFAPDSSGRPVLGLHERGAFDRVFALETCLLPSALTVSVVKNTQRFAVDHQWAAHHPRLHTGMVRFLTVRHLPSTGQCAVHLIASDWEVPGVEEWAKHLVRELPEVTTVTLILGRSLANVAFGEEERVLVGTGAVVERILGLEFEVTSGVFLQTNSLQAEALYARAVEAAGLGPGDTVLDLYCGTGTLTSLLARRSREAIGVESVAESVERARRNAARNGVANARFVAGEARAVLRQWARGPEADAVRPQVVVVDPPRAGLHPRVVARVAELRPRRVVYVSCNPATLARDLKDFATGGYRLTEVTPLDMFPHTPHIECVAVLERSLG